MLLSEVVLSLNTGLNPRHNFKLNEDESELPYVTGKDVYNNRVNITNRTDRISQQAVNLINKRAHIENDDVMFVSTGTGTVGRVAVVEDYCNNWAVSETMFMLKPNRHWICSKYLLFLLNTTQIKQQYEPKISKGSVPHLKVVDLLNVVVHVPTIKTQNHVVAVMESFNDYCNSLISGLPAEIEARQKQYEYYRDRLLTFKEKQ